MQASSTFEKPVRIANDFLPVSAAHFVYFAIGVTLLLRAVAYVASTDTAAVTGCRDWIYHAFWLPLHLFLARYAAVAFSRNVDACLAFSISDIQQEIRRRVDQVTSLRGLLASLALVAPFVFLDSIAAISYVRQNFATQGYAAPLIPIIWLMEWLATAQIWLYVLGSIFFNAKVLCDRNIQGRHEAVLVHGEVRAPLLCGLECAVITAVYGLSTVGYVWYAQGQLSDYLVMVISTFLTLICFFSALFQLKGGLRKSLDAERIALRNAFAFAASGNPDTCTPVPYTDFKEAVSMVFERRVGRDQKLEERLRSLRLEVVQTIRPSAEMPIELYKKTLSLLDLETRMAAFGMAEIRAVSLRAGLPIFMIVGKSAGGLIGIH